MKITQAVKSSVNAYLLARAHAETHREKVDKIQRNLLNTLEYNVDPKWRKGHRDVGFDRITDPKDTYLMRDDQWADYYEELKHDLIKAGYNIQVRANNSYNCPALVAEDLQRTTERLIIESAAEMLGEKNDLQHTLLCAGLDKYQQFIDLVCKLVVNMPGFKNPLTKQI